MYCEQTFQIAHSRLRRQSTNKWTSNVLQPARHRRVDRFGEQQLKYITYLRESVANETTFSSADRLSQLKYSQVKLEHCIMK